MADQESKPSLEQIMRISSGGWAAAILAAGCEHGVFTHLEKGADTVDSLAHQAGISRRGAATLLDGLTGLGFLTVSNGRYRNTPDASEFLVAGKRSYFGGFARVTLNEFADWQTFPQAVKSGSPQVKETTDLENNPFWEELVPAIATLSVPVALAAAERLSLAQAGPASFFDVGGGSGIYSALWLGIARQARSVQFDWPNVNAIAKKYVAGFGVGDRFRTVDGDFHHADFGDAEHDAAVYSHIAHQESPEENVETFRRIRRALKPGGTLVVSDFVVDDDRSGPPFALMFRSVMSLRTKGGSTWTRAEYEKWLREAGFTKVSIEPTPTPAMLVYAS
jgi:ubiquinone/menaquinone biosynthesis C-methylase UbiE